MFAVHRAGTFANLLMFAVHRAATFANLLVQECLLCAGRAGTFANLLVQECLLFKELEHLPIYWRRNVCCSQSCII